jgi:putative transposase
VLEGRQRGFAVESTVDQMVEFLRKSVEVNECVVPVYCFMPDHAHVMIMGMDEHSDSLAAMKKFKTLSGTWLHGKRLPQWQKNFFDRVLRCGEDWRIQARYIAENPVRAGLASDWSQYPFTGAIGCDLQDVLSGFR